jgi:hypothetical protein
MFQLHCICCCGSSCWHPAAAWQVACSAVQQLHSSCYSNKPVRCVQHMYSFSSATRSAPGLCTPMRACFPACSCQLIMFLAQTMLCVLLLSAAVCSGDPNGPCSATGKCMCFLTVQGGSCSASNMLNFPPSLNVNALGNGGGCAENLCNAVAAKQGLSAACCPYPCGK